MLVVFAALVLAGMVMANAQAQSGTTPPIVASETPAAQSSSGQTPSSLPSSTQTQTPTPTPTPTPALVPYKVVEVYNQAYERAAKGDWYRNSAGLNDIIIVKVAGLDTLVKQSKCVDQPSPPCVKKDIMLYLDGRPIEGLKPESGAPKPEEGSLRYHLLRTEDSEEHWADLLGLNLGSGGLSGTRRVAVSVGLEDGYAIDTDVENFNLVRARRWRFIVWAIGILVGLFLLFQLARRSDILRDPDYLVDWGQRKPYSLGRVQAAWWFVIIIISFIFIWLVTGQYDLSTTAVVLLGIGLGTALGSTVIDSGKRERAANDVNGNTAELNTMLAQRKNLEAELEHLKEQSRKGVAQVDGVAVSAAITAKETEYRAMIEEIKRKYPTAIGAGSEHWYMDIISDENGVSFHRFQMLGWTVVLGIMFVVGMMGRLAMPVFSETLLALMGLSAGTYLGFKIPENSQASGAAPATAGAGGDGDGGGGAGGGGGATGAGAAGGGANAGGAAGGSGAATGGAAGGASGAGGAGGAGGGTGAAIGNEGILGAVGTDASGQGGTGGGAAGSNVLADVGADDEGMDPIEPGGAGGEGEGGIIDDPNQP